MKHQAILTKAHSYATRARAEKEVVDAIAEGRNERYVIVAQPDGRFTALIINPDQRDVNWWIHEEKIAVVI